MRAWILMPGGLGITIIFMASFMTTTAFPSQQGLKVAGVNEVIFDDFIVSKMETFLGNIKEPYPVKNFDFQMSKQNNTARGNVTAVVQGPSRLRATMSSNLTSKQIYFRLFMFPNFWTVTGNYALKGTVDSLIIVKGQGNFDQTVERVDWDAGAKLTIDSDGYARIVNTSYRDYYSLINSSFQGIESEDIIGPYIQRYLEEVGETIFQSVHSYLADKIRGDLIQYLNDILQTITIEEILTGKPPTTTTTTTTPGPSTSTSTEVTTTTQGPEEFILDVSGDFLNSGWTIPASSSCGYANLISEFYCGGLPVEISGPYDGLGFWMSPCPGDCTLEFLNVKNDVITSVGFNAFYNHISSDCRITVGVVHDEGTQEFVFTKADGNTTDIGLSGFLNVQTINISMKNDGSGLFSVLDRLTLVK